MKHRRITGWILSGVIAALLIFASASGKFLDWEGKEAMFAQMGWSVDTMVWIGVVEVIVAVLFVIPRTAFYGAILLTAYLGGATATHVRLDDSFIIPVVLGVLAWIGLALRDRIIFQTALGNRPQPSDK